MKALNYPLIALVLLAFAACDKDKHHPTGSIQGGNVTVTAQVMHHTWFIPGSKVFIKSNVTQFPGTDTTLYDSFKIADSYGFVQFDKVVNGNYYLYAKGFDVNVAKPVWGYLPFTVSVVPGESKELDLQVPVSE